ncbi:MAG: exodeoxyribonuclease VII large subunit [Alphaproteobacteria bacterium]|nr:exodeoxyribonuclease VII large subunit [Alphaproteobacteria bacterium]
MIPTHNVPEFSVSEISQAVKRSIEDTFGYVRVRGEISGSKFHGPSGHLYLSLKDNEAVLNAVCFKQVVARLGMIPEDGLEVICTGQLTTYPQRSNYQLRIESMEPAGLGALMAMLEKRKKQLEAEGLFAPENKRKLPVFPQIIGVITSPTGAVIRDILHRLGDRYPCRVLVWGVAVQGFNAADQVAHAVAGFNAMTVEQGKPDVLIIARGGGSFEDLMPFNEVEVVRAVALSHIPVISAVGHETDTTLLDFVADIRAPTPTAAAEMVSPITHHDLMNEVMDLASRCYWGTTQYLEYRELYLEKECRSLSHPKAQMEQAAFHLESLQNRLRAAMDQYVQVKLGRIDLMQSRLLHPNQQMDYYAKAIDNLLLHLDMSMRTIIMHSRQRMKFVKQSIMRVDTRPMIALKTQELQRLEVSLTKGIIYGFLEKLTQLGSLKRMLEVLDYKQTLKRGFAIIYNDQHEIIASQQDFPESGLLQIEFQDGKITKTLS